MGLIKSLQSKSYLKGFYLVGGTALALYYGHRQSIDIDLFTNIPFDTEFLLGKLISDFSYQVTYHANQTLKGSASEVIVDMISHAYPYIQVPYYAKGLALLSDDIIAMKLNAISISGQRSKDFVDIYYALNHFSIADISFYAEKYKQLNPAHVIKSLIYFDELDLTDCPVMIKDPDLKWDSVKQRIKEDVLSLL